MAKNQKKNPVKLGKKKKGRRHQAVPDEFVPAPTAGRNKKKKTR